MILFWVLCIIASGFVGFGAGHALGFAGAEIMKDRHKSEMDEIFAEVKRLRAQVAGLIGKE